MSKLSLGSLSDLARILEEAANPDSELREDRRENRQAPPPPPSRKIATKAVDPKRKAWYERRLKEQAPRPESAPAEEPSREQPQAAAAKVALPLPSDVLEILSTASTAKPKKDGSKRPESWRRKPGDPIF